MKDKPDYLPTHDHFYAWIASNKDKFFEIFDKVHGDGSGIYIESILEEKDIDLDYSFEVAPTNNRAGYWDIAAKITENGRTRVFQRNIFIEFKTSLEEDNVEAIIRKIKKRFEGSKAPISSKLEDVALITFDRRFEDYKPILENEDITTIIVGEPVRKELKEKFNDTKSKKNTLDNF